MKVALLNCYFGQLPSYFGLWLQSCEKNPDVDFYFITDAAVNDPVPPNVTVIHSAFEELIGRIGEKFDLQIAITSPYKLTDFKPAYGYIFEDLFKSYDYWGYCDIDLVFGNILKFIRQPMEQGTEKIYRLGHLTVYKNTERMRHLFSQRGAMFSYKKVFSDPEYYSFDEHAGQMLITKRQGVSEYYQEDMADISCRIHRMTASRHQNYPYQVFYYENGTVLRSFIEKDSVITEEFVYIHFQKRKYQNLPVNKSFFILGDRFVDKLPGTPNKQMIIQLSEYETAEQDQRQLIHFRNEKKKAFLACSIKKKVIWLQIKIAEMAFRH